MLTHLLVPLDGSKLSEAALPIARDMLGLEGTLTLLNVIELPDTNLLMLYDLPPAIAAWDNTKNLLPEAQKNAQTYLHQVAEKMDLPSTVQVKIEVPIGHTASIIAERTQALHVDTIVMSTHGRSGLSRWMFGSVTQRVLSLIPCPGYIRAKRSF